MSVQGLWCSVFVYDWWNDSCLLFEIEALIGNVEVMGVGEW